MLCMHARRIFWRVVMHQRKQMMDLGLGLWMALHVNHDPGGWNKNTSSRLLSLGGVHRPGCMQYISSAGMRELAFLSAREHTTTSEDVL